MLSNAKNDVPRHGLPGLLCSVTAQGKAALFLRDIDIVLSLAFVACTNSSLSLMLVLAKFTNSISTME